MTANRVYLDSNIPMYAAGRPHPLRRQAVAVLRAVADNRLAAVTGAEAFQEILHRFHHIGAQDRGFVLFDTFYRFMEGHILPTSPRDVMRARQLMEEVPQLDARDAIHLAVMEANGVGTIISADRAFAHVHGVRWVPLEEWAVLLN